MTGERGSLRPTVDRGEGKAVVFVHGYPLHHGMWKPQLASLSEHHHVVLLDLPGFGLARDDPVPDTLSGFSESVDRALTERVPRPTVVVGHSFGGYVALQLIRDHPERFAGLVLADTRAGPDGPEAKEKRRTLARRLADPREHLDVESTGRALLAPGTWAEGGPIVDSVREMVLDAGSPGIRGALTAMAERPDLTEVLASIRVPVLVIWGEEDQLIPPAESQAMVARLPKGVGVGIARAGHLPSLEAPDSVNRALVDFLARVFD